ncbi:hypothetical protein NW762_006885 [Fusarium torreyae]|uniref:Uncharacterized protein n=1 Tax=Fusarium torreyae TaxID=1237075 RepID=A0A9W8RZK9_9HYPO|nr:hypothetical protein NW762_006885 [Fusarium torreyae]
MNREIPGYYYDPEKKKYFKIEKTQTAPSSAAWSSDAVKRRKIDNKTQKAVRHRAHLIRNHIKRHFVAKDDVTSALLAREIGSPFVAERGRGRIEDGDLGAAAWAAGLVAKGNVPFAPSFARKRYANMPCFYVSGEDEKTGLGVAYATLDEETLVGSHIPTDKNDNIHFLREAPSSSGRALSFRTEMVRCPQMSSIKYHRPSHKILLTSREPDNSCGLYFFSPLLSDPEDQTRPHWLLGETNHYQRLSVRHGFHDEWIVHSSTPAPPSSDLICVVGSNRGLLQVHSNETLSAIAPGVASKGMQLPQEIFAQDFQEGNHNVLLAGGRQPRLWITDLRAPEAHWSFAKHTSSISHIKSVNPHHVLVSGLQSSMALYDMAPSPPLHRDVDVTMHDEDAHDQDAILYEDQPMSEAENDDDTAISPMEFDDYEGEDSNESDEDEDESIEPDLDNYQDSTYVDEEDEDEEEAGSDGEEYDYQSNEDNMEVDNDYEELFQEWASDSDRVTVGSDDWVVEDSSIADESSRADPDRDTTEAEVVEDDSTPDPFEDYSDSECDLSDIDDDDIQYETEMVEEAQAEAKADTTDATLGNFDVAQISRKMAEIDLNDELDIQNRMEAAMSSVERQTMAITQEQLDELLSRLPVNSEALGVMNSDSVIGESVDRYQGWYAEIIDNFVKFALATGLRHQCPSAMRGWFLLLVSNAKRDSRERLWKAFTHPSAQPLHIQYLLGQILWSSNMFDDIPRVNLEDTGASGDVLSVYIALTPSSEEDVFLYCGSATSASRTTKRVGEDARMHSHKRILDLGHDEIVTRRRTRGAAGTACLYVHEKLALSGEGQYFFSPIMRYPINVQEPICKIVTALMLLGELFNMTLLASHVPPSLPRRTHTQRLMTLTDLIIQEIRPQGCPDPPWYGTNLVLPLLQEPRAILNLLRLDNFLVLTEGLKDDLRNYFDTEGQLTLPSKVAEEFLKLRQQPNTRTNIKILRKVYADILEDEGLEYLSQQQARLLKLTIIAIAIIWEAEERGLVCLQDGRRYSLEELSIDWINVSQRARGIAPPRLRALYTPASCRAVYYHAHYTYFFYKFKTKTNWDRLREGLPTKFAYARTQMRHPPAIGERIKHLCQFHMLTDMYRQNQIITTPPMIYLNPESSSTLTYLCSPVLRQLKEDLSLCPEVQFAEDVWEDDALKQSILRELHRARDGLLKGLPETEANLIKVLSTVHEGWAVPKVETDEIDTAHRNQAGGILRNHESRQQPLEVSERAKRLETCHVQPTLLSQADDRSKHRAANRAHLKAKAKAKADSNDEKPPFQLLNEEGRPLRERAFYVSRKSQPSLRDRAVQGRQPAPVTEAEETDSGTCDKCWVYTQHLEEHKTNCRGRCQACTFGGVACIRSSQDPAKCVACVKDHGQCGGFSHQDEVDAEHAIQYHKCWCEFATNTSETRKNARGVEPKSPGLISTSAADDAVRATMRTQLARMMKTRILARATAAFATT